jgi:hypothetical protein
MSRHYSISALSDTVYLASRISFVVKKPQSVFLRAEVCKQIPTSHLWRQTTWVAKDILLIGISVHSRSIGFG